MPKTKSPARPRQRLLQAGQVWRMAKAKLQLQIQLVGNVLVHYKLGKPDAVRVPNSIASKTAIEKFLKERKAVLTRIKRD
jgi:hypothetical protein